MKKKILNILKYTLFTALGVTLFWLAYRKQDFTQIWEDIKTANYWWVALSLVFGLFSHISRTLRWKIALEPLDEHPRTTNSFMSVMIGYFMNLVLPRMGEFVRCGMLSRYEKIPFSKLFGTVVTERIIDMLMLILLVLIVLGLEVDKLLEFLRQNPELSENVTNIVTSPILWIGAIGAIVGFIIYIRFSRRKEKKSKLISFIDEFVEGIKSILSMKRKWAYIGHTFFIWTMYFLMLYVNFQAFDFTNHLPMVAGLMTFTLASFGMVAPVQGGIGAWHFMATQSLMLYGLTQTEGYTFALLAHTSMNAMVIFAGLICVIAIPIVNRHYDKQSK